MKNSEAITVCYYDLMGIYHRPDVNLNQTVFEGAINQSAHTGTIAKETKRRVIERIIF